MVTSHRVMAVWEGTGLDRDKRNCSRADQGEAEATVAADGTAKMAAGTAIKLGEAERRLRASNAESRRRAEHDQAGKDPRLQSL